MTTDHTRYIYVLLHITRKCNGMIVDLLDEKYKRKGITKQLCDMELALEYIMTLSQPTTQRKGKRKEDRRYKVRLGHG